MTTVVVNDASCLIDIRKGGLLHHLRLLPYTLVIPYPVRESELLDFTSGQWAELDSAGMQTFDVPPEHVNEVFEYKRLHNRLSVNDCFCLVATKCHHDNEGEAILLTGDAQLRLVAGAAGFRVHGVLWVIDELEGKDGCDTQVLISALQIWKQDLSVFLPNHLIDERLARLLG